MAFTRSRKRVAGEGDGITNKQANDVNAIIDNEPSALPPKAKRQRTTNTAAAAASTAMGVTNAARTRKGRALKPVVTNANTKSNSNSNANAKGSSSAANVLKQSKGAGVKSTATSAAAKPVVVRATRRSRTATQTQQSRPKVDEEPQHQQHDDGNTSSMRATRAGVDNATASKASAVAVVKSSTSTTSFDSVQNGLAAIDEPSSIYQNGIPDDIDARDAHDPLSVTDYVEDMYEHFRSKEEISSIDYMYMGHKQPNINESMRCILVDWLIEVHYKFKLFPETLYLTVNILDRFLAETEDTITKRDLQLVGVTSLLISAKYEEMYVPELRDLTYICDGAYTEAKILRMEENLLKTLDYSVTVPTPHTFLIRFLKAAHADKLMAQLSCFLLDGTLLSLENLTCCFKPSQLAAAAILLARRQLGRHNWSPTLVAYSQYREEDVLPVARALLRNKLRLDDNRELMALAKKYSKTKYGKVSHISFLPLDCNDESSQSSENGDDSLDHSDL